MEMDQRLVGLGVTNRHAICLIIQQVLAGLRMILNLWASSITASQKGAQTLITACYYQELLLTITFLCLHCSLVTKQESNLSLFFFYFQAQWKIRSDCLYQLERMQILVHFIEILDKLPFQNCVHKLDRTSVKDMQTDNLGTYRVGFKFQPIQTEA